MILRMLLLFACLAVVSHAENCIQTINNQTFTHDPAKEPSFQNSTYKGMDYGYMITITSNDSKFYVPQILGLLQIITVVRYNKNKKLRIIKISQRKKVIFEMQMLTSLDVLWSVYRIANMWGALQIIVNYDPLGKLRQ